MARADVILESFAEAGYRLTQPRRHLAALIGRERGHFTADDLVARSRRAGLTVGRATIFRSLDILEDLGVIERLDLPGGEHAFVACHPDHHHHLVCSSCGRSEDVAATGLAAILRDLETRSGYRIDAHRLEVFGACPACRRRSA